MMIEKHALYGTYCADWSLEVQNERRHQQHVTSHCTNHVIVSHQTYSQQHSATATDVSLQPRSIIRRL